MNAELHTRLHNRQPFEDRREKKRFAVIRIECNCATLRYSKNGQRLVLSKAPAFTILALKKSVCLLQIGESQIGGIPEKTVQGEFVSQLNLESDVSQKNRFRERPGKVEV